MVLRLVGAGIAAVLLCLVTGCGHRPTRTLDPQLLREAEASVRRGQQLFLNDRLAWVASDLYQEALRRSGVTAPQSVVWAVQALPEGGWMVSFIIDLEQDGGYVDAEVYFSASADPDACLRLGSREPVHCDGIDIARGVRPVRVEEQRWVAARLAMLGHPALRVCSPVPPNFTLLRDGEDWYGYVLSASDDARQLIIAGHSRFRLSADGSQVLDHKPLFQRCRMLQAAEAELPEVLLVAGRDALFDEAHVFLHLDLRRPVQVRNADGRLVEIAGGVDSLRWRLLE